MKIVLLGAPGSGKTTQAKRIAAKQGIALISVASLLKEHAEEDTPQGKQTQKLLDAGQPVPDEIVFDVLRKRLLGKDVRKGYVLSDFPRNIAQAHQLTKLLNDLGIAPDLVLNIQIDNEALMERLVGRLTCSGCGTVYNIYTHPPIVDGLCDNCGTALRQRSDDNETAISNRLRLYYSMIQPVMEYYREQGKLEDIDGSQSREKIFSAIEKALKRIPSPAPKKATKGATPKTGSASEAGPKSSPAKKAAAKKAMPKKSAAKKGAKSAKKKATAKTVKKAAAKGGTATGKKKNAAPATKKRAPVKKAAKKPTAKKKATTKKAPARKKKGVAKAAPKKKAVARKRATTKTPATKKKTAAKKRPAAKKKTAAKKKR